MKEFLSIIGAATIMVLAGFIAIMAVQAITEGVKKLKYHYEVKHRFNKPPTAKCYCRDCKFHGEDGKCYNFVSKHNTNDSWYCALAEERKYYNEEEKA